MIRLREPSLDDLRRLAEQSMSRPFTYAEVGASRGIGRPGFTAPTGFDCDFRQMRLGSGDELFEAAAAAILQGRMFPAGWIKPLFPEQSPHEGDVVVVAASCFGLWWLNAARIVYLLDESDDDGRRKGFAYGTTAEHVESGEERFVIEQTSDGSVWYDLSAFSRPRHLLVRLGYPLARRLQRRFARDSFRALRAALLGVPGLAPHE